MVDSDGILSGLDENAIICSLALFRVRKEKEAKNTTSRILKAIQSFRGVATSTIEGATLERVGQYSFRTNNPAIWPSQQCRCNFYQQIKLLLYLSTVEAIP